MNKQKQRIAIAEFCGWDFDPQEASRWMSRGRLVKSPKGDLVFRYSIPDYLNDLNAMHEAEKMLTERQIVDYEVIIREVVANKIWFWYTPFAGEVYQLCHTTAAQRAEAFLKTIGRWEGGE
jgi:hypothetical protein